MEPALFSPGFLFGQEEEEDADEEQRGEGGESTSVSQSSSDFVERSHVFPGVVLLIREFSFHEVNANFLWPGTLVFAEWLFEHKDLLNGRRVLELGSGTGALAIFVKKAMDMDITTSDYDDKEIEENIAYNCVANCVPKLLHIRHTWGSVFPVEAITWDLIIASDILLYVKQYANLINTITFLLQGFSQKSKSSNTGDSKTGTGCQVSADSTTFMMDGDHIVLPKPCFLMSWRRRLPKEDEKLFFYGCQASGLSVNHLGSRIYCIFKPKS